MSRTRMAWVCVAGVLAGCNLISGVDEYSFGGGGGAATTGGAGGSGAGASGGGGAASGGGGAVAQGGGGASTAGGGGAGGAPVPCTLCTDDEWCPAGSCECRPGLTQVGQECVDLQSSPDDCGGGGPCAGATPVCQGGECQASCTPPFTDCQDACVDLDNDPLNCGRCGHSCNADRVCAGSECRDVQVPTGCDACPCAECDGDFDLCCIYPGTSQPLCLKESPGCP